VPSREMLKYVNAQPFRSFRILMNSGRAYDIRHPEMVLVGRDSLMLYSFVSETPDEVDHWETISLLLVESISHLDPPVR
jgi:hypothetical protein